MKNTENITDTSDTDEAFLMSARWALEGIALPVVAAVGLLGMGTSNGFIIKCAIMIKKNKMKFYNPHYFVREAIIIKYNHMLKLGKQIPSFTM